MFLSLFIIISLFDSGLVKLGSLENRFVISFNWDVLLLLNIDKLDSFLNGGVWDTDTLLLIKFLLFDIFCNKYY